MKTSETLILIIIIITIFLIIIVLLTRYQKKESFANFDGSIQNSVHALQFKKKNPSTEQIANLKYNIEDSTNKHFSLNLNSPLTIGTTPNHKFYPSETGWNSEGSTIHYGNLSVKDLKVNNVDITESNNTLRFKNCNNLKLMLPDLTNSLECKPGTASDSKIVLNGRRELTKEKIEKLRQIADDTDEFDWEDMTTHKINIGTNSNIVVNNNAKVDGATTITYPGTLSTNNIALLKWNILRDTDKNLLFQKKSDGTTVKFDKKSTLVGFGNYMQFDQNDINSSHINAFKPLKGVPFINMSDPKINSNMYLHTKLANALKSIHFKKTSFKLQSFTDSSRIVFAKGTFDTYHVRVNLFSSAGLPASYSNWKFEKVSHPGSTNVVRHGDEVRIYATDGSTPWYLYNFARTNYTSSTKINAVVMMNWGTRNFKNRRLNATRWIIESDSGSGNITNTSIIRLRVSPNDKWSGGDWTSYLNHYHDLRMNLVSYPNNPAIS